MRLPKSIKLMNITIRVVLVDDVKAAAIKARVQDARELEDDILGLASYDHSTIWIKKRMCDETKRNVFRHEVGHFVAWIAGFKASEDQIEMLGSLMEDAAKVLARR